MAETQGIRYVDVAGVLMPVLATAPTGCAGCGESPVGTWDGLPICECCRVAVSS